MQIKSYFAILIGLSVMFSCRCLVPVGRQMPQPDLSALKDDIGTLPLTDDFLPAVMQALHYYTEMMQYEQLQNPTAKPTFRPTTTTRRTTTTTRRTTPRTTTAQRTTQRTTQRQTTRKTTPWYVTQKTTPKTTRRPVTTTKKPSTQGFEIIPVNVIEVQHSTTPRPHQPGLFAPSQPPYWQYFGSPMKPEQSYHKPGVQRPENGINAISDPDWQDPAFIQWFFQPKPKEIDSLDENELQYLDPLPKKLLLDIHSEPKRLPALLDIDNVNEFRKKYDDSYYPRYRNNVPNMQHMRMKMRIQMQQQRPTLTGKKKPPPTRPYVHMLMLYDLLKREAKSKKLQQFGGFSASLLKKLHETSKSTGDYQMKYLLETMLERKEVAAADVLSRVNFIISDLKDEKSDTFKTLRIIPPLYFAL